MGAYSIDGGMDLTHLAEEDAAERERRRAAARNVTSGIVADLFGVRGVKPGAQSSDLRAARLLRDELYDALGLNGGNVEDTPEPVPAPKPAVTDDGEGRMVAQIRRGCPDDDWRQRSACRDESPELFFPIGTTGPALLQAEQAKAVCRRCDVRDECLEWALQVGQEFGVAGGMSEDERRAYTRTRQAVRS